jgi:glycerol-3-phosphate dehydrogenase
LRGGFVYYDCLTNDSRLVIEVVKAAAAHGAAVSNYATARGFLKENGRVSGVEVEDVVESRSLRLMARVAVSAAGVWSDEVSRLDSLATKRLRPSKGIHVVMPSERFGNQTAVLIPSLGEDRFLFVIPWCGTTLIGTTDSDYEGSLDDPAAEDAEVGRVIESAARFFPDSRISRQDVISSFAGLRPLVSENGESTAEVSRKEEIFDSASGLISIVGGKLTTYRHMAERVVDVAAKRLEPHRKAGRSVTREIPLAGGSLKAGSLPQESADAAREFGVAIDVAEHLIRSYGANYRAVLGLTRESEDLKERLLDSLPHIAAEVVYAARYEMAITPEDFIERRSRISLLDRDRGRSCRALVDELMRRA